MRATSTVIVRAYYRKCNRLYLPERQKIVFIEFTFETSGYPFWQYTLLLIQPGPPQQGQNES
jgi:hypothetical protein